MKYLADTTLLVDFYRRDGKAKEYIEKHKTGEIELCISVISQTEIWVGIKNEKELLSWIVLLDLIESINIDVDISRKAGELYKNYGHYMGKTKSDDYRFLADVLIAASAQIKNIKILTANKKHFNQLVRNGIVECEYY